MAAFINMDIVPLDQQGTHMTTMISFLENFTTDIMLHGVALKTLIRRSGSITSLLDIQLVAFSPDL
jgi:hypothetical protein